MSRQNQNLEEYLRVLARRLDAVLTLFDATPTNHNLPWLYGPRVSASTLSRVGRNAAHSSTQSIARPTHFDTVLQRRLSVHTVNEGPLAPSNVSPVKKRTGALCKPQVPAAELSANYCLR